MLILGVLVPVIVVQLSGQLELAMFLVSLLAVVVAGWEDSPWLAGAGCAAAVATPLLVAALQPPDDRVAWGIWMIGVAFPAVIGRAVHRQERLTAQLEAARRELAHQGLLEERRRIARDIHDLVGHGLAAVLLQVTSARHVLRRDIEAVDEALATAEEVGRRSMTELRRTVALLRREDDSAVAPPLPDLAGLPGLIDDARRDGLAIEYHTTGDPQAVEPAAGLALYRIAQEALLNATRHAPRARTRIAVSVTAEQASLEVASIGLLANQPDGDRPRYGLVGMRERAATVGGAVQAGPFDEGWRVCARVPVAPG